MGLVIDSRKSIEHTMRPGADLNDFGAALPGFFLRSNPPLHPDPSNFVFFHRPSFCTEIFHEQTDVKTESKTRKQ